MRLKLSRKSLSMLKRTLFLLVLLTGMGVSGKVFYVSPDGNDKNPGTDPSKPARSINRVLRMTGSGDTVMLRGGIYHELVRREWNDKNPQPVILKAFPDETPVISWGWPVSSWKKLSDGLWVADFPYAVCDLWQKITLDRYLKLESVELIKRQPGSFWQDPDNGRIYVNPLDGSWHADPENGGFIAVPFAGRVPPSYRSKKMIRSSGMNFVGRNIHVDGLSFEFHSGKGFYLRGRQKGLFFGSGSVRNCSAVGTTCGLSTGWYVDGVTFENCVAIRNSGFGIHTGGTVRNVKLINNVLINNGASLPFYGNYTSGSGQVYNLAHYGGSDAEYVDLINNKVISIDKSRGGGVMRFKPGIRKHTSHLNNLYLGGGVTLYSVPGSSATIRNNSVLPGIFNFTVPNSGEKYTPEMRDNLELKQNGWQKKGRFVNPEKMDYRLLPDSKYLGNGFAPQAASVWFVKPGSRGGDGRTPEKPFATLAELQSKIRSGDTVYFMAGNYSGSLILKNVKDVVLSDKSFNTAKWEKCVISFEKCSNIKVENMDFKDCTFKMKDTQGTFNENVFRNVTFAAVSGKVILANNDLEKCVVKSSGRVVIRENILRNVNVAAIDVVSEHNGFMTAEELKKWPFRETFKSFTAGVNGTVPLKNRVHGSRGTWIGGRVIPDTKPPLVVEYVRVTPGSCGTKAVVSWNTPKDYVQASVTVKQGKKRIFKDRVRFGQYLSCANDLCVPGLKPGTNYEMELELFRHNEERPWRKKIVFSTAKGGKRTVPEILEVGRGKKFFRIADAVRSAASGDTVLISPGFYPEMINVFADDLTIKAASPGTVRISGANMFDSTIQASHVKGLTIDGIDFVDSRYSSKSKMICINRSERIKIINCRFLAGAARRMGNLHVYGRFVKGFEVTNCVFDRAFHSIWLLESEGVKIDHNTIWGSGINAIHVAGGENAEVVITNNLCVDVVANHRNPAISVGHNKTRLICDWNLYWFTKKRCPLQKVFGSGGKLGIFSVGQIMRQDAYATIEECRKHYGIEKNGLFADPKMKNPDQGDFSLAVDSPARKRGSDGRDIGADLTVWK